MTTEFDHGGNIFTIARSLGRGADALLDFSASINPLGLAPLVREALANSLDRLIHYPDADAVELRQALAERHKLEPACIYAANGSTELIYLLPRLITGTRALIVAPAFSEYAKALSASGWDVTRHELSSEDDFSLSLDRLRKQLSMGFDALFLCNPGNPTGRLVSPAEIKSIHRLCLDLGTFLVLDEAFIDFCEEASAKHEILKGGGIVLRSMTKFFGIPGLRLGYAVGAPDMIARLAALHGPWSVNTLAQIAGVAALGDENYRVETLKLVSAERSFLAEGLAALAGFRVYRSAANYLLVEIDWAKGMTASELRKKLLPQGILIRDCSNFTGLNSRFFRVAVRTRFENEQLLRSLKAVTG
jgi:threonine-phosphate decarboxylase